MRESTIEAKLKALCVLHGARVHKLHRCRNGEADRIICPRGRQAFYCEVKRPGEKLSATQMIRLAEAAQAGFDTVVFDGSPATTTRIFSLVFDGTHAGFDSFFSPLTPPR